MNSLISINYKFMEISPKELVENVLNSKYTRGFEVFVNYNKKEELEYLDNLVFELKKYNLILQIHGNVELEFNRQVAFLKELEKYSDYLGYPIVLTLHTIYDEDEEVSMRKTIDYISSLIEVIDTNKVTFCLENLNDLKGTFRLGKDGVKPIVLNDEKIFFTYDIGHEIADFGSIIDLDNFMIDDIRNIHIHSVDNLGNDHKPIYLNDNNWNKLMKSLIFLINNGYKYNVVYEYGLEYCHGDSVLEKLKDYLESIDEISLKYSNN